MAGIPAKGARPASQAHLARVGRHLQHDRCKWIGLDPANDETAHGTPDSETLAIAHVQNGRGQSLDRFLQRSGAGKDHTRAQIRTANYDCKL